MYLHGTKGKQEIELSKPATMHNIFQAGQKDEFYVENIQSVGDLESIEVDVTHPNIKKLGLDYIEIFEPLTSRSFR